MRAARSYVACLRAKVVKVPWSGIFGRFSAEDEQRPKLVSAHRQIPLWLEKSVTSRYSTFSQIFLHYDIVIFWTMSSGQRQTHNCPPSFQQNIGPKSESHSIFFNKSWSSALTLVGALICFTTPPFSYTKIFVRISLICGTIFFHTFSLLMWW